MTGCARAAPPASVSRTTTRDRSTPRRRCRRSSPRFERQAAARAGHPFDNCLLNLYETGHNTMGFHHDSYDGLVKASWIAIASLGAARPIVFRSLDRHRHHQVVLEHGSILLMNRETQLAWAHALPRAPAASRRIILTFRRFA